LLSLYARTACPATRQVRPSARPYISGGGGGGGRVGADGFVMDFYQLKKSSRPP